MKRLIPVLYLCVLFSAVTTHAQLRAFTPRYTNASVRGNIKFVANNIITTHGGTTTEAPPSGTSVNNNGTGVNIDIDATPVTLIPFTGNRWYYLDNGAARPAGWEGTGFNHSAWLFGNGEFGYGDGDETTCIRYGGCNGNTCFPTNNCAKAITTFFRDTFQISNISNFVSFVMSLKYDDGAVIYINGVEASRVNMPTGAMNNTILASSQVENATTTLTFPPSMFNTGTNTIAVEIHQRSNNEANGDITFNLQLQGITGPTFNSSSADLSVTACSEVLFAGLYWCSTLANSSIGGWRTGHDTVYLKIPGSAVYAKVVSSQTDLHDSSAANTHTGYQCFADVTSLLNITNPNGTYTVANVTTPANTNILNQAAGWTLVIAYKDPTTIPRNLVVFDGYAQIAPNTQADVPIAGFVTPVTGPVSCELGAVCLDGDRNANDGFFFKQDSAAAGVYTNLTPNGTSDPDDMWNSTISYMGVNVTSRNPAHANTLGYDADILLLPNGGNLVLGNNRTSARIRISSPTGGENFFLQVVTSSISVSNPSFTIIKTGTDLSGGSWSGSDSLQYRLISENRGIDTSTNSVIIDTLSPLVIYKPGSLRINGVLKTDAAGDDQAQYDPVGRRVIFRLGTGATSAAGGEIIPNRKDTVTFTVIAINSCQILACNNAALNQGHMTYVGKNSTQSLVDHSGYIDAGGCFVEGAITNTINGTCFTTKDTTLVNPCPSLTVTLPASLYNGYTFYRALPLIAGNIYNPATPIAAPGNYYAYYNTGIGCSDTVHFIVLIQPCPDLDDDDDGIPDLLESGGVDAFADADLDGIPNFADPSFASYVDSNNDGVNDNFDADKDGVPNQIDRDSDNDGIPDVVEAGGVDANGDGRIDNFTDTDFDGLSQNVDANNTGAAGSGNGLGLPDLDGDGVPNYIDLDSDNDGIPDVREVNGIDANNDGKVDNYTDTDGDGYSDALDGDVGNDGTIENPSGGLLKTGPDGNNDGRADSYPNKNFDGDTRANPYDLDSDNDGITDVREGGFTDANSDGFADGTKGADGWDDNIDALGTLVLPNSDGSGNPNYMDIDADNDGIPDNIEGPSSTGYQLPTYLDTDGDGLDNRYDNAPAAFGGNGNTPNDQDGDLIPDYMDLDTDNDGLPDIIEGNDFNLNNIQDDLVTLTGVDTDGDGLDDRFDLNNSNMRGTSLYMGAGGSVTGDPSPGSRTVVQRTLVSAPERDWRYIPFILDANFMSFSGNRNGETVKLNWVVTCDNVIDHFDIERSVDGIHFEKIGQQAGIGTSCRLTAFSFNNSISSVNGDLLYYRINSVSTDGKAKRSNYIVVRLHQASPFAMSPNPANTYVTLNLTVNHEVKTNIRVMDETGRIVLKQDQVLNTGYNSFSINNINLLHHGVYTVQVRVDNTVYNEKLVIRK
jgi:uncharacterized repeat protein (TIGR01451 family)